MADNQLFLNALDSLTSDDLDAYTKYVTGSTPSLLAAEITTKLNAPPLDQVGAFLAAVIIAATTQKRVLTEWLAKAEQAEVARYFTTQYFIQDHINFSALNMIGHSILASDYETGIEPVVAFRARLDGKSIWHSTYRACNLSDEMKRIFQERASRFSQADAVAVGNTVMAAIFTRAGKSTAMD